VPKATTIGVLVNPKPDTEAERRDVQAAALALGLQLIILDVSSDRDIETAFATFVQSLARPGGNITGFANFESMIGGKWLQLIQEVDPRITRIGVIFNPQTAPFAGSYLRSVEAEAQGPAADRFRLIINLQAAKALGLTIPEGLLLRADEVIE
jgi:putative ABC transport system substrate-binding protein